MRRLLQLGAKKKNYVGFCLKSIRSPTPVVQY